MQTVVYQALSAFVARLLGLARKPALLAIVLLGLILTQPMLCLIHCTVGAYLAPADPYHPDGGHILCTLSDQTSSSQAHIPIPPFWPSLPTTTSVVLTLLTLLMLLSCIPPSALTSISRAPPLPPPRPRWYRESVRLDVCTNL